MTEAYIAGSGIALPPKITTQRFIEIDRQNRIHHGQSLADRELLAKFADNAQIEKRHTINPAWHAPEDRDDSVEDIFTPYDFNPPAHLRAKLWHEQAPRLALAAARNALADWEGDVADITHVVTTSTTGWSEPGIAVSLIRELGLSQDTCKIEINFNGCFCGASCLRTARDIVRGGESGAVLVVAVELSTIQYNIQDTDVSTLISTSLFSDGAGAMIVAPEGEWHFEKAGMSVVPQTEHLLRLNPDFEQERAPYKMFLHQGVSKALHRYFAKQHGKTLMDNVLALCGDTLPALAVHPGGPNILCGVKRAFKQWGWSDECLDDSYHVLRQTGNLGAAAVLFVLHRVLHETQRDEVASFAFGPGVTVEWGKLSRAIA